MAQTTRAAPFFSLTQKKVILNNEGKKETANGPAWDFSQTSHAEHAELK